MEEEGKDQPINKKASSTKKSHKRHKATAIIVSILIALVVGVGGFCLGKFVFKDQSEMAECPQASNCEPKKEEKSEQVSEAVNFPTAQVQQILADKYGAESIGGQGLFNHFYGNLDNFNDQAKLQFVVAKLYPKNQQEQRANSCVLQGTTQQVCQFDYAKVNQDYQLYFGSFSHAPKNNFHYDSFDMTDVAYDADKDSYTVTYGYGLGGTGSAQLFYKVVNAQQQGNNMEAIVIVAVVDSIVVSNQPCYRSSSGGYNAVMREDNMRDIYDNMQTYKFTFTKDNGDYFLKEITNLKSES